MPLSRRSWGVARRYVAPPLAAGLALAARRQPAAIPFLAGAAMVALFFRDPARLLDDCGSADGHLAYAAADGKVTRVVRQEAVPWLDHPDGSLRIVTYLNLLNVHVTRSPVAGVITDMRDAGSGFRPAFAAAADHNKQVRVTVANPYGDVGVILAAGILARTITTWVAPGGVVTPGRRLALIHFGSRTDVLLPAGLFEPLVRPGDRVVGGQTAVARRRPLDDPRQAPALEDIPAAARGAQ